MVISSFFDKGLNQPRDKNGCYRRVKHCRGIGGYARRKIVHIFSFFRESADFRIVFSEISIFSCSFGIFIFYLWGSEFSFSLAVSGFSRSIAVSGFSRFLVDS